MLSPLYAAVAAPDLHARPPAKASKPDEPGATTVPQGAPANDLRVISLRCDAHPVATIVVLTQNNLWLLRECLASLSTSLESGPSAEVVVLFNGTPQRDVEDFVRDVRGLRWLHVRVNLGFGAGNNFAAARARGRFLVFLNDDAVAHPGWLSALVERAEASANAGIVGSRIYFPDGTLQEAGGIVWSDGSTAPLGRGEPKGSLAYTYRRPVDYTSANGMLVRRESFERLGGFDERFYPAYYEDVDLCLGVRHTLGEDVVYEPAAEISHVEGASSSGEEFRSFLFRRNQAQLREKWSSVLAEYASPEPTSALAVERAVLRRRGNPLRVLVIDDRLPDAGLGSGFGRGLELLEDLSSAEFAVALYPSDRGFAATANTASHLGVDVVEGELVHHLRTPGKHYDVVVISRPHNFEAFYEVVRAALPEATIVFDVEALYHKRLRIAVALERDPELRERLEAQANAMEYLEAMIARSVDRLVCVSEDERHWLERVEGHAPVEFMRPLAPRIEMPPMDLERRRNAVFVPGWLGGDDSPNVDALEWYARSVVPRVRQELPDFVTLVTGKNPPKAARRLASPEIVFTGYLPSLLDAYARARIAISPIRIGAGVKIKTLEAMQYGVPVVATPVGAEGLGARDGIEIDVAADAAGFAQRVVRLAVDDGLWHARREAIERTMERWLSERNPWPEVIARARGARRAQSRELA